MGETQIANEIKDVTAMFSDIVGFTTLSEHKDPAEVLNILNTTLGLASKSIMKHNGSIDKFMGDSIFSIFDDPLMTVIAAVEIQNLFTQLNEFRELTGEDPILLRIGIHTGKIIMGSIGTHERMDWTAIGDVINTSARLEKLSKKGQVLISEVTYNRIKEHVTYLEEITVDIRGKENGITAYFVDTVLFEDDGKKKSLTIVPLD